MNLKNLFRKTSDTRKEKEDQVTADISDEVKEYYRKAEQGDAVAQYNLGYCYAFGQGIKQSYEKAAYWWTKAAEQRDAIAQYNLGCCYEYGQGVGQVL